MSKPADSIRVFFNDYTRMALGISPYHQEIEYDQDSMTVSGLSSFIKEKISIGKDDDRFALFANVNGRIKEIPPDGLVKTVHDHLHASGCGETKDKNSCSFWQFMMREEAEDQFNLGVSRRGYLMITNSDNNKAKGKSRNAFERRWFTLQGTNLYHFPNQLETKNRSSIIPNVNEAVISAPKKQGELYTLTIQKDSTIWTLGCGNEKRTRKWYKAISKAKRCEKRDEPLTMETLKILGMHEKCLEAPWSTFVSLAGGMEESDTSDDDSVCISEIDATSATAEMPNIHLQVSPTNTSTTESDQDEEETQCLNKEPSQKSEMTNQMINKKAVSKWWNQITSDRNVKLDDLQILELSYKQGISQKGGKEHQGAQNDQDGHKNMIQENGRKFSGHGRSKSIRSISVPCKPSSKSMEKDDKKESKSSAFGPISILSPPPVIKQDESIEIDICENEDDVETSKNSWERSKSISFLSPQEEEAENGKDQNVEIIDQSQRWQELDEIDFESDTDTISPIECLKESSKTSMNAPKSHSQENQEHQEEQEDLATKQTMIPIEIDQVLLSALLKDERLRGLVKGAGILEMPHKSTGIESIKDKPIVRSILKNAPSPSAYI